MAVRELSTSEGKIWICGGIQIVSAHTSTAPVTRTTHPTPTIQSLGIPVPLQLPNPPLDPPPSALRSLLQLPLILHPHSDCYRDCQVEQYSPAEGREEATPRSAVCEVDGVFSFVRDGRG